MSPITGQVIGREEVRVTKNRESIVKMDVTLVAGLHLEIEKEHTATADPADDKALYEAKTTFSKKLSSKYQVRAVGMSHLHMYLHAEYRKYP